jgi:cytochrome subunit of sulfide dehydrogenase
MIARAAVAASLALACSALAQQPAPPHPQFAPPNLTPAGVRALAAGCATCHGTEGQAVPGSAVGSLAGLPRGEIVRAMALFKEGRKPATVMHQIAKGFTDPEIEALDDYFSQRKTR